MENQEYLSTGEALQLCRNLGKPLTKTALYQLALKRGFARKSVDGFHWEYERAKLEEYLKEGEESPPEGWITVLDASGVSGLSLSGTYNFIQRNKLVICTYGSRNVKHVEESAFMEAWRNRASKRSTTDE